MGFHDARRLLIEALRAGRYSFEPREVIAEKNLLAIGAVDAEFVVHLLQRCPGYRYRMSRHDHDATVAVHTFLPDHQGRKWYVKAYFLSEEAVFISVHESVG